MSFPTEYRSTKTIADIDMKAKTYRYPYSQAAREGVRKLRDYLGEQAKLIHPIFATKEIDNTKSMVLHRISLGADRVRRGYSYSE